MISALVLASALTISQSDAWNVTENNCLTKNGLPYIPVGANIDGTLAAVEEAKQAGITDIVINLKVTDPDWKPVTKSLENAGIRYYIAISDPSPVAKSIAVEPENYRMPDLMGQVNLNLRLTQSSGAFAILAGQDGGTIRWSGYLPAVNNVIQYRYAGNLIVPHVLVLYPELNTSELPDFWEAFDLHRDKLLTKLKSSELGPNYQGLIDPFGKTSEYMTNSAQSIPDSDFFRMELEAYLQQKYGSVSIASSAWGLSASRIQTLSDLTYIIPLWSEFRGIEYAWNRKSNELVNVDRAQTSIWTDIRTVMFSSSIRRYQRLTTNIRQITGKSVIQNWSGWGGPYEHSSIQLEGIGVQARPKSLIEFTGSIARPLSSARRSPRPVATIATKIELAPESGPRVNELVANSQNIGVRGWYFAAKSRAQLEEIAQVSRLLETDKSLSEAKPRVLYYPEAAHNPATITQVAPGTWWIPAPGSGSILDFGEGIEGYQYNEQNQNVIAIWATTSPVLVKFRGLNIKELQFESTDGTEVQTKLRKNEIEVLVPTRPILIRNPGEIPVPFSTFELTSAMIEALIARYGSRIDIAGTAHYEAVNTIRAFDASPTASFFTLRKQWRDLAIAAAPYNWIEAERSPENTFSTIKTIPGASDSKTLALSAKVFRNDAEHHASYILSRVEPSQEDVWISGKIPASIAPYVKFKIGGKSIPIPPTEYSFYGAGLAWYHIGRLDIPAGETKISITCPPGFNETLLLDSLVFSPNDFVPSGSKQPMAWLLQFLGQDPPN